MSLPEPLRNMSRLFNSTGSQAFRTVSRCILVALWLLESMLIVSNSSPSALYLLPVLALLSFLMADYFSSAIIAILLTTIVNTVLLTQVPGSTRAWVINAIWLTAVASVTVKLLHPVHKTDFGPQPLPSSPLPANLRHDLQTPISMILGYCGVILRAVKANQKHGQNTTSVLRDNVQAIYRNAQQLEKLLAGFFDSPTLIQSKHASESEAFDLDVLIHEAITVIADLLTSRGIKVEVTAVTRPKLVLHGLYVRQILLNILRTLALASAPSHTATLISIRTKVDQQSIQIRITGPSTSLRHVMKDASRLQNDNLLKTINARLWIEESVATNLALSNAEATSELILSISPPANSTVTMLQTQLQATIVVISESPMILAFFQQQLGQYTIINVKDIDSLRHLPPRTLVSLVAVVSDQALADVELHRISDLVGNQTPVFACPVSTTQELSAQLKFDYLPKPVDYNTLTAILSVATSKATDLPSTNVLIVEDNLDSAEMLAQMISAVSSTFNSHKVYLAQDALSHLDQYPICAVFVDLSLPDMDGITLIQRIRAHKHLAEIPIVLMSAYPSLDSAAPITASKKTVIYQPSGFEFGMLAAYIDTLYNQKNHAQEMKHNEGID